MYQIFAPHAADFYKCNHAKMYPEGSQFVYSNFTCRSDARATVLPDYDHKVVLFGLQGLIQTLLIDCWNDSFFRRPKSKVISQYRRRMDNALGAGAVSTKQMSDLYEMGFLPLEIKALPEGSRIDIKVPMFTIQNTRPEFYWLTNYVESQLSAEFWKSITNATTAYEFRRLLNKYAEITGGDKEFVPWQGHDFSFRGMSNILDATTSGAAHLLSFYGTDTITAIDYLEDLYGANSDTEIVGGSVPATEHSVMCMGGKETEIQTFKRLINDLYPTGIISIVSDTWDFWKVVTEYMVELKPDVMARQPNNLGQAKVVIRPDSGDPVKILCGDLGAPQSSPEYKGAVECLWDIYGGTITSTGYKQLDSHVGLIYGDSINLQRAQHILERLQAKGFASTNVVLGIGSYTYQYVTRDTYGSAMKATFGVVKGEDRVLFKQPKTDDGIKNSAKGLLRVERENGKYVLHENQTREQEKQGLLETVFLNGKAFNLQTLSGIRARLWS